MIKISNNTFQRMVIESLSSVMDKDNSCHVNLEEGRLDDVYGSENFQRWFNGSKIVDENGRPKLLGHATRNFGFNKFNTPFIHLAPINDAAYFSGGKMRLFKYKKTINSLSDEDVVSLLNQNQSSSGSYVKLDEERYMNIMSYIDNEIKNGDEKDVKLFTSLKNELIKLFTKSKSDAIYYRDYFNGRPYLYSYHEPGDINNLFFNIKNLRNSLYHIMFDSDNYLGRGGVYPICAKVINPINIECNWGSWDKIYIRRDNCDGQYEKMWDYCENNGMKMPGNKGSWFSLDNESIAYIAKKLGFDGVIFHHIKEGFYGDTKMDETYIVFSTKQLKSPFENNGEFGNVEHLFK